MSACDLMGAFVIPKSYHQLHLSFDPDSWSPPVHAHSAHLNFSPRSQLESKPWVMQVPAPFRWHHHFHYHPSCIPTSRSPPTRSSWFPGSTGCTVSSNSIRSWEENRVTFNPLKHIWQTTYQSQIHSQTVQINFQGLRDSSTKCSLQICSIGNCSFIKKKQKVLLKSVSLNQKVPRRHPQLCVNAILHKWNLMNFPSLFIVSRKSFFYTSKCCGAFSSKT